MRPLLLLPVTALVVAVAAEAQAVPAPTSPEPPPVSFAKQGITEACQALQANTNEDPSILEDRVAAEILKAMVLRPGETAAARIVVGINNASCTCNNPGQVAELATRLGFLVGRNIGDVEDSAALVCDPVGGEMRLVTVPAQLNQIEACIGNTELAALSEAVYERLQSPTGNALALSTVKFSDNCLCESNYWLDFLTRTIDEAFADDPDTIFGFARFGADLGTAGCIPEIITENTDERIIDPVSPSRPNT